MLAKVYSIGGPALRQARIIAFRGGTDQRQPGGDPGQPRRGQRVAVQAMKDVDSASCRVRRNVPTPGTR
jgi:hypothetical protein